MSLPSASYQQPAAAGPRAAAVRHSPLNIYTVMLIIALVCLLIGTIVLVVELRRYGFPGAMPWRTDDAVIRTVSHVPPGTQLAWPMIESRDHQIA